MIAPPLTANCRFCHADIVWTEYDGVLEPAFVTDDSRGNQHCAASPSELHEAPHPARAPQPRERRTPCGLCNNMTWNFSGLCDWHEDRPLRPEPQQQFHTRAVAR